MTARALRRIERELIALTADDEPVSPEAVRLAARRVGAQAEMLEQGVEGGL